MPKVTLIRSGHGPNGTATDPASGVVLREGQTVDVPADVADRLMSTEVLGDVYEVEEDDQPAPADADASPTPAPEAQEVSS